MSKAKNHEFSMQRVCLTCFGKATSGRITNINVGMEDKLKKLIPDYLYVDNRYPRVLCKKCRPLLTLGKLKVSVDYCKKNTRGSRIGTCYCDVCLVAREHKPPTPRKCSSTRKEKVKAIKHCENCMSTVARGVSHKCTVQKLIRNVVHASGNHKEQVAAEIINSKDKENDMVTLRKIRGRPMKLKVLKKQDNNEMDNRKPINSEFFQNLQKKNNFSVNTINTIGRELRSFGKGTVEWGALKQATNVRHDLDDYFAVELVNDVDFGKEKKEGYLAYCKNLAGMVAFVCDKRELTDFFCKINIDSGRGSLKVSNCFKLLLKFLIIYHFLLNQG